MTTHEVFKSRFMQEEGMAEDIAALDVSLATVQQVSTNSFYHQICINQPSCFTGSQ